MHGTMQLQLIGLIVGLENICICSSPAEIITIIKKLVSTRIIQFHEKIVPEFGKILIFLTTRDPTKIPDFLKFRSDPNPFSLPELFATRLFGTRSTTSSKK